jgi:hypothetical protein
VTPPELGNTYRAIRDDHIQAMLQLRYRPTEEREGIQRMLRDGIIERNEPSEGIAPLQMSFFGQAAAGCSGSTRAARPRSATSPTIDQPGRQDMPTAQPVPSSADGSYTRPPSVQQQIFELLKRMPRVDAQGRDLPPAAADPTVISIVDPGAPVAPPAAVEQPTGEPAQGMAPNALQGHAGGVSVPTSRRGSTLQQLAAQLANGTASQFPEGYVPAPPR